MILIVFLYHLLNSYFPYFNIFNYLYFDTPFIIFWHFFGIFTLTQLDHIFIHFIHELEVFQSNCCFIQSFVSSLSDCGCVWLVAASGMSLLLILIWHSLMFCVHQLVIQCLLPNSAWAYVYFNWILAVALKHFQLVDEIN